MPVSRGGNVSWRCWPVGALTGLIFMLFAVPVIAQGIVGGVGSSRPSLSSVVNRLPQNLGRIAGDFGAARGFSLDRSAGNVATVDSMSGFGGQRRGLTSRRRGGGLSTSSFGSTMSQRSSGAPLLNPFHAAAQQQRITRAIMSPRRSTILNQVGWTTFEGRFRPMGGNYEQTDIEQATARYASWGAPELVQQPATQGNTITLPGQSPSTAIPAPEMSLQTLARNRLDAQRKLFEHRAWEVFKEGHYRDAYSYLNLAASAVLEDAEALAYYKVAQVYAGIAAQEYTQAAAALHWVVGKDLRTGEFRDARALNSFRNVATFYVDSQVYTTHNRQLETFLGQAPPRAESQALRAMIAWGQGDLANAMFLARQAAESAPAESDWRRLPIMMQEAEDARRLRPARSDAPSVVAPLEMPANQ